MAGCPRYCWDDESRQLDRPTAVYTNCKPRQRPETGLKQRKGADGKLSTIIYKCPTAVAFRWPLWGIVMLCGCMFHGVHRHCGAMLSGYFRALGQLVQIIGHDVEIMAVLPGCAVFHTGNDHFTAGVRQQICKGSRRISSTCSSSLSDFHLATLTEWPTVLHRGRSCSSKHPRGPGWWDLLQAQHCSA